MECCKVAYMPLQDYEHDFYCFIVVEMDLAKLKKTFIELQEVHVMLKKSFKRKSMKMTLVRLATNKNILALKTCCLQTIGNKMISIQIVSFFHYSCPSVINFSLIPCHSLAWMRTLQKQ